MKAIQHIENEYKAQVAAGCGTSLSGFEQKLLMAQVEPFYSLWRAKAAISVAHMLEVYETLGVDLPLSAIKGETWYAGIPSITQAEVDWANTIKDTDLDNWLAIMPSYLKTFKGIDVALTPHANLATGSLVAGSLGLAPKAKEDDRPS
jgi:hypothetical protein